MTDGGDEEVKIKEEVGEMATKKFSWSPRVSEQVEAYK